ncbi:4Fe-4S dicluster domain-containing protein [Cryptobacterium curtum]|mgnify:FL=1|uniref:4Fe-4S dicluster domain-containing protein n=1 Tax=Cryptobacterium curtum TaxID=84163 RepID=UPI0028CFF10C|nr:4Fe-4S dicluster domain-containing protein [Cryptobacterium curtum]
MSHYALVVDLDRCFGCHSCEASCKNENNVVLGSYWNRVLHMGPYGSYPDLEEYYLPSQCMQCKNAPCVNVCPTAASYRDPDTNIVLINKEKCIGCKYCMMACPYGVRSWNVKERVVEKCTLCQQRTSVGQLPACVEKCCASARFYGDLDDPDSEVSKALASANKAAIHTMPDYGNEPVGAYILSDKIAAWREDGLA